MKAFFATSVNDGKEGALHRIDGNLLEVHDGALVINIDHTLFYTVIESDKEENYPDIIKPLLNAGSKRWELKKPPAKLIAEVPQGMCEVLGLYVNPITGKLVVEYEDTPK